MDDQVVHTPFECWRRRRCALVTDPATPDLLRPVAVSVAATAGLLILAMRRAGRQEL